MGLSNGHSNDKKDDLKEVINEFLYASSTSDARQMLKQHPELLSDEADSMLDSLSQDAKSKGTIDGIRSLLARCREVGTDQAFEEISRYLEGIIKEFLNASNESDARQILEQHPELLSEEADSILDGLSRDIQSKETFDAFRSLLALGRIIVTGQAFEEISRSFNEISQEDLPIILNEIKSLVRPQDMPRKILLLQNALSLTQRQSNPELWSAIQIELGNSLYQNPQGDRDDNIETAIEHYNQALEVYTQNDFPIYWANTQNNLGNAYWSRLRGDRDDNIEKAIEHYNQVLEVYTQNDFPMYWAGTQSNLGNAYMSRVQGNRAENIEEAIKHYNQALKVRTHKDFTIDWATTQNNLGLAYNDRIWGNRAENIEKAIEHFNQALKVYTRKDSPVYWAGTQNNLGLAYSNRIRGDRAENIEKAIEHLNHSLEVYTHKDFPMDWARTQNNLGASYKERIRGDRAENIEQAIEHYNQALEVQTHKDFPMDWATTQNNLGTVYSDRIRGDRAENIEQAIEHYNQALEVRTHKNLPVDWALTQNNLGAAYENRIRGDRAENIEQAIVHYNDALEVYTYQDFPKDWAAVQNNLGLAYSNRIRGDRAENIEQAIEHYNQALEVRTHKNLPVDWATTQNNLGLAYNDRVQGNRAENIEEAIKHNNQALKVRTHKDFPVDWAGTQNNLGLAYKDRIRGNKAENIEKAIEHYNQALRMYTQKDFPLDWAMTQNNLGTAYRDRIRGDRAENIEKAISHFHKTLDIYKLESMPNDFRRTCRLLGDLHLDNVQWADAMESYKWAIKASDLLYRSGLSSESKTVEVSENAYVYRNAALAAYRMGLDKEALLFLEGGKTRLLSEALRLKMKKPENVPEEEWTKYEKAADKYRTATRLSGREKDYAQWENKVQKALENLDSALKLVQTYDHEFQKELDISDVLSIADSEIALMTFCLTSKGSIGFAVSGSGQIHSVDIPDFKAEDLNSLLFKPDEQGFIRGGLVVDYWNYINSSGTKRHKDALQIWQKTLDNVLLSIGTKLLGPLLAELSPQIKKLIILPSGGLFLLPLHAVPLSDGQLFCQRYCISYAPSIPLLREMQRKAGKVEGKGLYAVINPQEDPRLVFSGCEGKAISKLFQSRQVNEGKTGTRRTVLAGVPSREYLHFSCHGSYNWNDPPQSGLYLVGGKTLSLADLQSDEVDMSSARLVTLSACETGTTDILKGSADEFVGLPAGFMIAGVPCVVSSLWSVPDISTALLMERFYSNHVGGMDIPLALQEAQLWVRDLTSSEVAEYVEKCYNSGKWEGKSKEFIEQYRDSRLKLATKSPDGKPFQNPYYWAAFTVNGA